MAVISRRPHDLGFGWDIDRLWTDFGLDLIEMATNNDHTQHEFSGSRLTHIGFGLRIGSFRTPETCLESHK